MKYYKGLGTSTAKEFKEYFAKKKIVYFEFTEQSNNSLDLVFNKKRTNELLHAMKYKVYSEQYSGV